MIKIAEDLNEILCAQDKVNTLTKDHQSIIKLLVSQVIELEERIKKLEEQSRSV